MVSCIAPLSAMTQRPTDICSWQKGAVTQGLQAQLPTQEVVRCSLKQQLLKKPICRGWNVVESAKWQSWSQLGEMAPVEAMRLYMRLLESEQVSCATQTARPHCPFNGAALRGATCPARSGGSSA